MALKISVKSIYRVFKKRVLPRTFGTKGGGGIKKLSFWEISCWETSFWEEILWEIY